MGSNLCRARAFSPDLLQVILDLFSSRTGCIEVFLRVALDLGLTVLAAFDLIAQPLQAHGKLGTVDTGRILLRLEKTPLLQCPRLALLTFGQIENDSMRMKLRCGIPIHRTSSVMLEGGGNELGCRLRRVDIADTRLRVPLQLVKRHAHTFAVCHTHTFIAADKRGERNRFRRGECRVPPGAMFDASNFLTVLVVIRLCRLVPDELRAAFRMLSFAQPHEFFDPHGTA